MTWLALYSCNRGVYAKLSAMARLAFALVLVVFASLLAGCSASLFKVKPVTELSPLPNNTRSSDAGGVTVLVAPLLTDEESQELFEANLPLCGVLPLRVALDFQSGVSLDIARARFRLRDNQGRQWKLLSTKQAISRILTANGVSAYNPNSRKQFAEELGAYALDLKTPISASEPRRQGFLFFQPPDKRAIASNQQLVLTVERLPQTATINLN
jgi:hypothetical protein